MTNRTLDGASANAAKHTPSIKSKRSDCASPDSELLAEKQHILELIVELTPDIVYLLDIQKQCHLYSNRQLEDVLGYVREDNKQPGNSSLAWAIHSEDLQRVAQHADNVKHADDASTYCVDYRIRDQAGKHRWVSVTERLVRRDANHVPEVVFGMCRDVTVQKLAEQELRDSNQRLEQQMALAKETAVKAEAAHAAKTELLANMSLEIRAPTHSMIGTTEQLLDTALSAEQRRFVESIHSSGKSLLALLNDVVETTKIEASDFGLALLDFELPSLLDELAATLAPRAHAKGLGFVCAAAPSVPVKLRGDKDRLRQLLVNLISNSLAISAQGEVAVRAVVDAETIDSVCLRFTVADTGTGSLPHESSCLSRGLGQLGAPRTRDCDGFGVRLGLAKQLCALMGGSIGVESREGNGSTFWFTVSLMKQSQRAPDVVSANSTCRRRVLLVDDHMGASRDVMVEQLQAWGLRVGIAGSCSSILATLQLARDEQDPFTLVILDLQRPSAECVELARLIRTEQQWHGTKLIVLTTSSPYGTPRLQHTSHQAATLTKPIRWRELREFLESWFKTDDSYRQTPRTGTGEDSQRSATQNAHILVVDDDKTNQLVARGILKKLGHRVDAVDNGVEAVKALELVTYDLVLMDLQMPEMDGIDATRFLRARGPEALNHAVPIVSMTAHVTPHERTRCLEAGMSDHIAKPLMPNTLREIVAKWLPKIEPPRLANAPTAATHSMSDTSSHIAAETPNVSVFIEETFVERLMEDRVLCRTILRTFLEDLPKQLGILERQISLREWDLVRQQAHRIKGAAATVNAELVTEVALALERAATTGDVERMVALLADLKLQAQEVDRVMNASSLMTEQAPA